MTKYECETKFLYNAEEPDATVSTFSPALKNRLQRLMEEYPEDVTLVSGNMDLESELCVRIPKSWLKIRTPRKLTEEQHAAMSERGKKLYETYLAEKKTEKKKEC